MISNKISRVLAALAVMVGSFMGTAVIASSAPATADVCTGTWTIGIGGFNNFAWQNSWYIPAHQQVGYNTGGLDMGAIGGKDELNRLFWDHRNQCPGDHIKLVGHSEGAGIVHSWVTENGWVDNANAVLLADPKRNGWDTGIGLAQYGQPWLPGYPLTGVDDWFGDFPVLNVCRWDDGICRTDAGPVGYFEGHHGWYNFDPNAYGDWDRGTVMV